jgi:CRISPR/Cas system CSM-associated protein Csm5 (group 7 of RAMP superfamily)
MIAANGMYYHDGNRIESSTKPFLGYGGRWFLIETINETYVTNNLFSFTSFHPILSAKINPRKIYIKSIKNISKEEADEFRESQKVIKQLTSKF